MTEAERTEVLALYERALATNRAMVVLCLGRNDPERDGDERLLLERHCRLVMKRNELATLVIDGRPSPRIDAAPAWGFLA